MTASGRKQPLKLMILAMFERLLWVKADTEIGSNENLAVSGCFTPDTSHSPDMMLRGCC